MKSRYKAIFMCGLVVLILAMLFGSYGYNNTWRLWNIPTLTPNFADLRIITHGAESYAQGFDPMINNPGDPWQRIINYPRVWQCLYLIGVNQTHTTYVGIIIIFSFLVGVCLILPNASNMTIAIVLAALLSPAILWGVERCNIDLFIFFLAAISVVAVQKSYILSILAIFIGFVLKLFPIFEWVILVKAGKSRFMLYSLVMLTFVGLYSFLTYSDILLVSKATPRATDWSYGINVFWMKLSSINPILGVYAHVLSYSLILLTFIFAFSVFFYSDPMPRQKNDTLYLDAFRAGSAIYTGTFLIGNNWDYRLAFLIFTIPQLILWTKHAAASILIISKVTIVAIFISLWYFIIIKLSHYLPYGLYISFILDEMSHWITFSSLMYLFIWSLPRAVQCSLSEAS